jgi:hypothetical protein
MLRQARCLTVAASYERQVEALSALVCAHALSTDGFSIAFELLLLLLVIATCDCIQF